MVWFVVMLQVKPSCQSKRDYVWLSGHDSAASEGFEGYIFDFNDTENLVNSISIPFGYDGNNAAICDEDGNLLMYSNGCAIANRNHEIMPNGDSINYTSWYENNWFPDCSKGYPSRQDILLLPKPGSETEYVLITKPIQEIEGNAQKTQVTYSKIDLSLNNGLGEVTAKNIVAYEGEPLLWSYLNTVQHANGDDWWIIQPLKESSSILTFLLNIDGVNLVDIITTGPFLPDESSSGGFGKFSPDGSIFVLMNQHFDCLLYNFDRETGSLQFENQIFIDSFPPLTLTPIEFSSNGEYLYITSGEKLFQLNVNKAINDDTTTPILIEEWNGNFNPTATQFTLMQRGPDCRIYMNTPTSSYNYHVIKKPNEEGVACEFVQQAIEMPELTTRANIPNFPNFRIDEEEYCDPTITSLFGLPIQNTNKLGLTPNPAYDSIKLEIPENKKILTGYLIDSFGQTINSKMLKGEQLDISNLHSGIYILHITLDGGKVLTERFVKI